jgi:hypothetical protein
LEYPQLTHNSYLTHLHLPYFIPAAVLIQNPFLLVYTWAIQVPEGTPVSIQQGNCEQKPEDKRLEGRIQCTDEAQKISTLLLN